MKRVIDERGESKRPPAISSSQAGWGVEQPGLVEGVPVHGRRVGMT